MLMDIKYLTILVAFYSVPSKSLFPFWEADSSLHQFLYDVTKMALKPKKQCLL